jgi:hypothetical protein
MDITEQQLLDKVVLLHDELPREAGRLLLDWLLALRVFARSVVEDAEEQLDAEPLTDAVPDVQRAAFDALDGVVSEARGASPVYERKWAAVRKRSGRPMMATRAGALMVATPGRLRAGPRGSTRWYACSRAAAWRPSSTWVGVSRRTSERTSSARAPAGKAG